MSKPTFKKVPLAQVVQDAIQTVTEMPMFEVFRTGTHTDSAGNTKTWTQDELQQIVDNFKPDEAAFVLGHPKDDAPAYGWGKEIELTQEGKLLVSGDKVSTDFAKSVYSGSYPKRSVGFRKKDDGTWYLNHIAFLGAVKPALADLAPVGQYKFSQAQDSDITSYDFSIETQTANVLVNFLRKFKSFLATHGEDHDEINKIIDDWDVDWLQRQAIREEIKEESEHGLFSISDPMEELDMQVTQQQLNQMIADGVQAALAQRDPNFQQQQAGENEQDSQEVVALKQQLDAEKAKNAKSNFAALVATNQSWVNAQVAAKKLLPAQAQGLAEFMAHIGQAQGDEPNQFTFSQGEGDKATTAQANPVDFMKALVEAGAAHKLEDDINLDDTSTNFSDSDDLDKKITQYQQKHGCSYNEAFDAVVDQ